MMGQGARGHCVGTHLIQGHPDSVEGHKLEGVQLQQAPHEALHGRQHVREADGQVQQPLGHQAPLAGLTWGGEC